MKRAGQILTGSLLLGLAWGATALLARQPQGQQQAVAKTHLKVGDLAPDFTLEDHRGKKVKLRSYRGKKNVVLAFYVLAHTAG
jgi:cytochrome oxidase Cu insertion factor (SCO1/SenC/PrrC family)